MPAQFYCLSSWIAGLVGAELVLHFLEVILDLVFVILALFFVDVMEFPCALVFHLRNWCLTEFWIPDVVEEVDSVDELSLQ